MKSRWLSLSILLALALLAIPRFVFSEDEWVKVADLKGGGGAKEVTVNREITQCKILCLEEPIIINTLVVREGGKKTPIRVAQRFMKNDERVLDLGGKKNVTGFRISDDNRGRYEIWVK